MTTVPSAIPLLHPWNVRIDNYLYLAKTCCDSDNFTPFETLLAKSIDTGIDYKATLDTYNHGNKDNVGGEIEHINENCVIEGQTTYDEFTQAVNDLKNTEPDEPTWIKKIDDAAAAAKLKAQNAIDAAAQQCKEYIGGLPESTQDAAANLFVSGLTAVLNFFETVWDGIKTVLAAIGEFLKGVWDKVTSAFSAVKAAAQLAISFITGGLGRYLKDSQQNLQKHGIALQPMTS